MGELLNDDFHTKEAQRRLLQLEEFKLKVIALESEWMNTIGAYFSYFGDDEKFKSLLKKFDDWDSPSIADYDDINDPEMAKKKFREDDETKTKEINETLGEYCKLIINHIEQKLS